MATQPGGLATGGPSPAYIKDALLIVLNPRQIPDCVAAFKQAPLDVVYIQGAREAQALPEASRLMQAGGYARYLLVSDDVVVTAEAIRAVVQASELLPGAVVTGYCNLDAESTQVNITRTFLAGDTPTPEAYDFYERDEITAGNVFSGFAGMALTCIPASLVDEVTPLGWYGEQGYASDFHLSKRLEHAGIPIVAPAAAFVHHVKERWNEPDQAHSKRLRIGKLRVVRQSHGRTSDMALINSQALKGGQQTMSDKIAEKDIIEEFDDGRRVVRVPKGQPIPDDLGLSVTNYKAQPAAPENKARTAKGTKGK